MHGIRSCLALPLNADGEPVGALNLYSREASAFGAAEARRAENLAEMPPARFARRRLASHAALIEQLRSSLTSRTVIDQALGVIMAREHCTQTRAFAILRSASQNSNVKLRDIAGAVVASMTGVPPQPAPPLRKAGLAPPSVSALATAPPAGPGPARRTGPPSTRRRWVYVNQPVDPGYREHRCTAGVLTTSRTALPLVTARLNNGPERLLRTNRRNSSCSCPRPAIPRPGSARRGVPPGGSRHWSRQSPGAARPRLPGRSRAPDSVHQTRATTIYPREKVSRPRLRTWKSGYPLGFAAQRTLFTSARPGRKASAPGACRGFGTPDWCRRECEKVAPVRVR